MKKSLLDRTDLKKNNMLQRLVANLPDGKIEEICRMKKQSQEMLLHHNR